jgi:hypothetical protein
MTIELTDQQADDWLARLEDPATKRFERRLRGRDDPEAMCCLGHLADIIDPEGWTGTETWWSWESSIPSVTYRGLPLDQNRMTGINDYQHRFPIPEIRQWIEKARTP